MKVVKEDSRVLWAWIEVQNQEALERFQVITHNLTSSDPSFPSIFSLHLEHILSCYGRINHGGRNTIN